ncbi:MAG: LysR family transcriptional regulator [Azospirillaceae bacterium]|nr:LysR family transcriptional regulator [Azospirillaceae bacterium]
MSTTNLSLTFAQLQCFVGVVDTGSFAAAGRQLGLTTSGVSKTVARLEMARGVRLLNRSTHSLSLTDEGEFLIHLAREALLSVGRVEDALGSVASANSAGRVRISAPAAFVGACLVPLLPRFRELYPEILLDLRASDTMVDLADQAIDLALRTGTISNIPGHLVQLLFTFRWVTCAAPEYLARKGAPTSLTDLSQHDLIAFRNQRTGLVDPWRFPASDANSMATRHTPSPAVVVDDANAACAAALAGAGLLWAPEWLVNRELGAGRLVKILPPEAGERMKMSIIRRDQPHNPERIARVLAFLKESRSGFTG